MNPLRLIPVFVREHVERRPLLVAVLNNIAWLFVDKFIRIFLGLLVGAWVARYLGPGQFGDLAYIVALVGIFQSATQLGLDNIAVRDISRNPESAAENLGTIFRLRIVSGFLCYVGVIMATALLRPADDQMLVLAAIVGGIVVFQSADTIDLWFQSALQNKRAVLAKSFAYFSVSVVKIVLIVMHLPLITFAAAVLVEAALSAFALAHSYKKYPTTKKWFWSTNRSRHLLAEGLPFLASSVALTAYMQTDRLILEALMGSVELGHYVAALTLSGAFTFLPVILFASLAPRLASIGSIDEKVGVFVKLNSILWWGGALLALLIYAFADFLTILLYGVEYRSSVLILRIHAFSLIPIFLSVANDYLALVSSKGTVTLVRTIVGLGINISLNYVLIPRLGAPGAAISSLVAHAISNTLLYWLLMRGSFAMHSSGILLPITNIFSLIRSKVRSYK